MMLQSLRRLRFTFDRRFTVQSAPSELCRWHTDRSVVVPPAVDRQVLIAAINRLNFALRAAYGSRHVHTRLIAL